jgi:2,4-diaminopentanoate dehydrogenase
VVLGHIMTAMPTINAIAAVVAGAPGVVTYADQPLTLLRGVVAFERGRWKSQESAV